MPKKHIPPTILIIVVLVMQMSTFVTGTVVWPWMGYAMYAHPKHSPVRYREPRAYVVFADGQRLDIDQTTKGLGLFAYKDKVLMPMVRGNLEIADAVKQRVETQTDRSVADVRLEVNIYVAEDGQITHEVIDRSVSDPPSDADTEDARGGDGDV